jgi:hypothetical protein
MLSKKKQMEVSLYCYAAVGGMMASMLNDKYRGKSFTWAKFPEMMERHCEINVCLSVVMSEQQQPACRKLASKTGKEIAESWVKEMTA